MVPEVSDPDFKLTHYLRINHVDTVRLFVYRYPSEGSNSTAMGNLLIERTGDIQVRRDALGFGAKYDPDASPAESAAERRSG